MKEYDINMTEYEKQRREDIKKSGHYLEFTVTIGGEELTKNDGEHGVMPVINTVLRKCNPSDISMLYASLREYIKHLEAHYPVECMVGKLCVSSKNLKTIVNDIDTSEEEEK